MIVGYARTRTTDQKARLDAQVRDLKTAGCEKVFSEQVSSVAKRPKLAECLAFLRQGDTLLCTEPDSLARSLAELLTIEADLTKRGVSLVIQSMGSDTSNGSNPTARLMLSSLVPSRSSSVRYCLNVNVKALPRRKLLADTLADTRVGRAALMLHESGSCPPSLVRLRSPRSLASPAAVSTGFWWMHEMAPLSGATIISPLSGGGARNKRLRREVPAVIAGGLPTARGLALLSFAVHGETPGVDVATLPFREDEVSGNQLRKRRSVWWSDCIRRCPDSPSLDHHRPPH